MKILVTGGAGFIGSHIADLMIENDHDVTIIDNFSTGKKENLNPKAKFYNENILNFDRIKEIFETERPEIVYHLAAQIDIRKSLENPVEDAKVNVLSTLNLLELSVKHKLKHFIFSSTGGAIYGDTEIIPTPETEKEAPVSPYGCAKLAAEKYLNFYSKIYSLKYTALRYANVYGPRQNPHGEAGVVAIFFENMLKGKTPIIFGGTQTRDFVYVKDVANANLLALNDKKSSAYNISTSKETSINEIFEKINKFFHGKFRPDYQDFKKGEQKRSCISYKKIRDLLGWEPKTNLDDGLKKTFEWYVKNQE